MAIVRESRPSVFVGSSSEAQSAAEVVIQVLREHFNVDGWFDIFNSNENIIDELIREIHCNDFAVLLLTEDDNIHSDKRGTAKSPRDNVVFELGLFTGGLGKRRAIALVIGEPKIATDYDGVIYIKLAKNALTSPDKDLLENELSGLVSTIKERYEAAELQLLPSTAIAIGYVENFLKPVCNQLSIGADVEIDGNMHHIRGNFMMNIILPKDMEDVGIERSAHHRAVMNLPKVIVKAQPRGEYPLWACGRMDGNKFHFYDFGATLRSSHDAIDRVLADSSIGISKYHSLIGRKEIENFRHTIRILLRKSVETGAYRNNIQFGDLLLPPT